jgi:hypothetical protein
MRDAVAKLRQLMRQRDAVDTLLLSSTGGLAEAAERIEAQRAQHVAALEEARKVRLGARSPARGRTRRAPLQPPTLS